ncbi:MAG: cytochrome c oxidase assembly protein [Solirubrobacterales bacterium]|nr:cytochrome c oxidase assembly protein [Solirubrobacterales bacterium]
MAPPIEWTYEPSVIVGVAAMTLAYCLGWRRARGPGQPHPPGYGRLALFAGAMLCVLAALISPVDSLADSFLSIHMVQHLLLLDLFPILVILSLTKGILRPVTRRVTVIERKVGLLAHPWFALFAYIVVMIVWHIPHFYDMALQHPDVHVLEHICFSTAGFLYWWHLLSPIRGRMHLDGMSPVMYMVITKLTVGMLGVALTFAPSSFYGWYQHQVHYWGMSAQIDQSIAGLVMALEQSIVMGIAIAYLFARALDESEREAQRAERFGQGLADPVAERQPLNSDAAAVDNQAEGVPALARRAGEQSL